MTEIKTMLRVLFAVLLLNAAVASVSPAMAAQDRAPDKAHVVMAGFLYKFFSFTQWPEGSYPPEGETVSVCILGENPFGTVFDEVEGDNVGGRTLTVRQHDLGAGVRELSKCQMVFVPGSSRARVPGLLEALADAAVLTMSDIDGFADSGGMVEFFEKDSRIRFIINRGAAEKGGIKFRARILRVAAEVRE